MAPRNRNSLERSPSSEGGYSRADLEREFPDDATCLEWLWREHYSADGEHAACPKCGVERKFHRVQSRPSYSCDTCGHHIHPTAGTIFHKSSTSLALWFKAVYIMGSTRCGASAKQIERELGVTYKTAWRMANLIRKHLMAQDDTPLEGEVEIDETLIGGRPRVTDGVKHGEGSAWAYNNKAHVWGGVERGGRVHASVIPHRGGHIVRGQVRKYVLPESVVYSDDYGAYSTLHREGYTHHRINHSAKVYVEGEVHTQTIEGFWSTVKNGIRGTYHAVSHKHLQGYLNEFAWRYNNRGNTEPMFKALLASI